MVIGGAKVRLEQPFEIGSDDAAHQHQRVDRKERVGPERRDVVAAQEALGLERVVFGLVLDAAQRLAGRHVAGRLVDAAEQHRDVVEFHAGALLDAGQRQLRQVGVRTSKIEMEFDLERSSHGTPFPSIAGGRQPQR
ncbi:hypothetical protein AB7M56_001445 [Bradyrhizobium elkanii]